MDRTVRLYPALIFMVAITSVTHIYREKMVPKNFALQVFYALTYLTDLHQQTWIGFPVTIWQNLWSLAIEEQFYIFWSLLVPFILILNVRRRSYLLICGIALSALMQYSNTARLGILPHRFCFRENPFFNFWKMLLGAFIRLVPMPSWTRSIWASRCGLVLLSGAILTASSATAIDLTMVGFSERYVGYLVYGEWLTALATMLIILGVVEHGNTILEMSILRFVGRVSYSLYLFQSPLLVFGRSHRTVYSGLSITALALCAATFSTFHIEEPLREAYKRRYHKIRADANHAYSQVESSETIA
jgi:peptidoglycan/LPS O-acetylase OafA/YrhL